MLPDKMEHWLDEAEKAIDALEKKVGSKHYQLNPQLAVKEFTLATIEILRQQHRIQVLLEHRLADLDKRVAS